MTDLGEIQIEPIDYPCMCCDTTNASLLIQILCYNPCANGKCDGPDSTNPIHHKQNIYWLAVPIFGLIPAYLFYDKNWNTRAW